MSHPDSGAAIEQNADGVITSWDASAEQLFGWRRDEALGRHADIVIPRAERGAESRRSSRNPEWPRRPGPPPDGDPAAQRRPRVPGDIVGRGANDAGWPAPADPRARRRTAAGQSRSRGDPAIHGDPEPDRGRLRRGRPARELRIRERRLLPDVQLPEDRSDRRQLQERHRRRARRYAPRAVPRGVSHGSDRTARISGLPEGPRRDVHRSIGLARARRGRAGGGVRVDHARLHGPEARRTRGGARDAPPKKPAAPRASSSPT